MIDENNLLNFYCTGIYDSTKALTDTEIIMKVIDKLNLVILNFNDLENKLTNRMKTVEKDVNYYLDTGLKLEVSKKLDEMVQDGTFNSVINEELLEEINNQVLNNTEDIKILKETIRVNGNK